MLSPPYQRVPWKSMILQPNLHPRFKFNFCLAAQGRLATVDRLLKFGIQVPQTCVFCGLSDELFVHLFFVFPYVKELWSRLLVWLGHHRPICDWSSKVQWITKELKGNLGTGLLLPVCLACWFTWVRETGMSPDSRGEYLQQTDYARKVFCTHTQEAEASPARRAFTCFESIPLGPVIREAAVLSFYSLC